MNIAAGNIASQANDSHTLTHHWAVDPRWKNVTRPYTPEAVLHLRRQQPNTTKNSNRSQQLWAALNGGAATEATLRPMVFDASQSTMLGETFISTCKASEQSLSAIIIDTHAQTSANDLPRAARERIVEHLVAARLAADVAADPLLLIARIALRPAGPNALDAKTAAFASATYSDIILCEADHVDLDEALGFARSVHALYPNQLLMYRCTALDARTQLAGHQEQLFAAGFTVVQNALQNGCICEFENTWLHTDDTETPFDGKIEDIVKLSIERGASQDLSGCIIFDETIAPDLQ